MTRLRSGKTTTDAEDDDLLNNVQLNDLNGDEEETQSDHLSINLNHVSRVDKKAPYAKLRQDLNDLDDSNLLNGDGLKKRKVPSRGSSRSRSSSRTRTKERSTSRERSKRLKDTYEFKLNKISTTIHKKQEPKASSSDNQSSCKCLAFLAFLIVPILVGGFLVYKHLNPPTVDEILQKYKSNLVGQSNYTIKAAIDKFDVEKLEKPVVLILYGKNQTTIEEFYLDLASAIKKGSNVDATVFKVNDADDNQLEMDLIKDNLKQNKIVLLDGLQKLKSRNYMQLYALVDEEDALVTGCLVVISLYHDAVDPNGLKSENAIEKEVRSVLRNLWQDLDPANLEALLNRIVTFYGVVV